jgi:RHS repeat-associated protein
MADGDLDDLAGGEKRAVGCGCPGGLLRGFSFWARLAAGLAALILGSWVLGGVAVGVEGRGGPPTSPPEKEKKCNESSPDLEYECVGKPVNNATGDETEEQTDIQIGGRGPGLVLKRSYDSFAAAEAREGPFGIGWSAPYNGSLEVSGEKVVIHEANGSAIEFYESGSEYTQGGWDEARLVKESSGSYVYTLPDQSKEEFNSEGKLVKETDHDGNSNTLTYKEGKLEKVTDGDSRSLTFKYNGEGLVESVTDPMGHVVSYTYSAKQLASVKIEGKVRWEFEYTSPHLLSKVTDGREHSTTIKYEATTHRVTEETQAGHTRKWKYGTNETTLTEPNGSETLETFNTAGEPTKITRAKGKSEETTTEYEYETSTYARVKMLDPNKHEWKYGYDAEGNKTSEKDPNGDERKWKYNTKHEIESETTPEGETTTIKRNGDGNPEAVERPAGSETQKTLYTYTTKQDLSEEVAPPKGTVKFTYDPAGDKETETDAESNKRRWEYNEDSQVTAEVSPRGFTTKTVRNEYGLPTKITDPLGHTTEYKYDGNQNIETEVDGNGHTTKYVYNEENLPTKVEEADGNHTETGYDSEGQMTSHTDGNSHKWEYKRNALEQVTEEINPLGQTTKKTYEKAGNLASIEDPEKHVTTVKYDESNRPKEKIYSTGNPATVKYTYNKDSLVTNMSDGTGETVNSYDKLDRLTEYVSGAGKTVKYTYNLDNQPTAITYPNGKAVKDTYDKDARLEKVIDWNNQTTKFSYNPDSQLEKTTFPSGTEDEDTYAYNEADQMTEVKMSKSTVKLASLAYTRDGDGQVKETTNTGLPGPATIKDTYDASNRLTESGGSGYEYNAANSPTKIESTGTYTYNSADELEEGAASVKYAYNDDGQRTQTKPASGEPTNYSYDQVGNLTKVERATPTIKDTYTYNGNNLRQTQTINSSKANLTWDTAGQLPLILNDEANNYIYGPENLPIEQIPETGETQYLHHDQQGSTRILTNTKGETEAAYTYNPYGTINTKTTKGPTTPLLYDAQYTNTDTELIYLRARTYDPNTAQFLSIDPALRTTSGPYTYTKDNPENSQDLTGRCEVSDIPRRDRGWLPPGQIVQVPPPPPGQGKGRGAPFPFPFPLPFPVPVFGVPPIFVVPTPPPPGGAKGGNGPEPQPKQGPRPGGPPPGIGKKAVEESEGPLASPL